MFNAFLCLLPNNRELLTHPARTLLLNTYSSIRSIFFHFLLSLTTFFPPDKFLKRKLEWIYTFFPDCKLKFHYLNKIKLSQNTENQDIHIDIIFIKTFIFTDFPCFCKITKNGNLTYAKILNTLVIQVSRDCKLEYIWFLLISLFLSGTSKICP